MTAPGGWAADPPEINSAGFWLGPGASSFMASAAELSTLAGAIIAMLGGDEALAAALAFAWPAPTGDMAVLANVPHLLWQGQSAMMLLQHAAQIEETATAFETLKAATPTPGEVATNQAEHVALNAANFLGMLTPLIIANRAQYFGDYWVRAATNKYSYAAASASGVQAMEPLPPPVPTSMPMGGADAGQQAAASDPMSSGPMSMLSPVISQIGSLGSQLGQVANGGGLMSLPQQALSPLMSSFTSLSSGMGAPGAAGALEGTSGWVGTAPSVGGPVSASLSAGAGGIGGLGGGGFGGASAALRGPVSWSSATVPTGVEAPTARLVSATSVSTAPAGIGGMGGGAMMAPLAARAATEDEKEYEQARAAVLTSMANFYRAPVAVPVVTGGSGALLRGEGAGQN